MKNLWRITVLFMLPGVVLGGGMAMAFFRLADADAGLLKTMAAAAVWWCLCYWAVMHCLLAVKNLNRFYYIAVAVITLAFSGGLGLVRLAGGWGWIEGAVGTAIAAAGAGCLQHCFCSGSFSRLDRISFVAGTAAAMGAIFYLFSSNRLAWLETMFFYVDWMLLLLWSFASPLTLYGSRVRRWSMRVILLVLAGVSVKVSPAFSCRPWTPPPPEMADGKWQRTFTTAQGSRFLWIDRHDHFAFYTPAGRRVMSDSCDEHWASAMPLLLGVLNIREPAVKLAVPPRSALPEILRELQVKRISLELHPESVQGTLGSWNWKSWSALRSGGKSAQKQYDLLIITALNDNQYPGAVKRNWEILSRELADNAVTAVEGHLLQHKELFNLLHKHYCCYDVLPLSKDIWVFSKQKLDFSAGNIDAVLHKISGTHSAVVREAFTLLDSVSSGRTQPGGGVERDWQYGSNRWLGSWFWCLAGVAIVILWRLLRLLVGRRQITHEYWRSVENGFAGMGIYLLALGVLIQELGIFALAAAVLTVPGLWSWSRLRSGGVWITLFMTLLLPATVYAGGLWLWLLVPVMLQSALFTNQQPLLLTGNVVCQREFYCANAQGMLAAASLLLIVWYWGWSLLLCWACFAALRLSAWRREIWK